MIPNSELLEVDISTPKNIIGRRVSCNIPFINEFVNQKDKTHTANQSIKIMIDHFDNFPLFIILDRDIKC